MIFQDDDLDSLLREMHQQWRRARAVRGAGRSISLACILLLLACLLDYFLRPPYGVRVLFSLAFFGTVLAHVWHSWLRHFLEPFSARRIAWRIENRYPMFDEKIISAVELEAPDPNVSVVLVDWLRVDAEFDLATLLPQHTFPLRWHSLRVAAALVLAIALGMVISPTRLGRSVPRVLWPELSDATAGPFTLDIISPGDAIFHEGNRVNIVVRASDPSVNTVELHVQGEQSRSHPMRASANTGHHAFALDDLRYPFRYWAQAGSVRSPIYQINVAERPRIESYKLQLEFPKYTGQPPVTTIGNSGDITALAGTAVTLELTCSQPLRRIDCVYDGHTHRGALSHAGRHASIKLTVGRSGDFAIRLTDLAGRTNRAMASVHALPDEPPSVAIVSPPADLSAEADDALSLTWHASDDFAIQSQRLIVTVNGRPSAPRGPLLPDARSLILDLAPLALRAGDLVAASIEVTDGAGQAMRSERRYIQIGSARRLRPALPFLQAMQALHTAFDAALEALPTIGASLDHIRSMETASKVDRDHHLATLAQRHEQLAQALTDASRAARQLRDIDLFNRASATAALIHAVLEEQRLFRLPNLDQSGDASSIASIDAVFRQLLAMTEELETRAHLHIARHTLPLLANRLRNLGDDPVQVAQVHERARRLAESANLEPAELGPLEASARRALANFDSLGLLEDSLLAQHRGSEAMLRALAESLSLQPSAWAQVLDLADEFRAREPANEHDELIAGVLADAAKLRRPGSIEALAGRLPLFDRHQAIVSLAQAIDQFAEFASTKVGQPAPALAEECSQLRERPLPLQRLSQHTGSGERELVAALDRATRALELGKPGAALALKQCREQATALLGASRQRVQRSRRELLRYTEPPSVALRPLMRQLRALAVALASQPSLRQRHEARDSLATVGTALQRLAGDLTEATVTDLRDPRAQLLLACDRLALALHLRTQITAMQEIRDRLDSAPGASADRLRTVADALQEVATFAAHFEAAESGLVAAPEIQAASEILRKPVAEQLEAILTLAALQRERRALEHLNIRIDEERPAVPIRRLARRVATLLSPAGQASLLAACGDTVLHAHDAASTLLNDLRELRSAGEFTLRRQTRIDNTLALLNDATAEATHVLALFDRSYRALPPQLRDIRDRYRQAAREESVGALDTVIARCKHLQRQLYLAAAQLPARRLDFAEFAAVSDNVDPEALTIPLVALDELYDLDSEERAEMMRSEVAEIAKILAAAPTRIAEYANVIAQRLSDNVQLAELAVVAGNIDALWRSVPALATTHNLGYQRVPPVTVSGVTVPGWSRLPSHARLGVCLAFAQSQATSELAAAVAVRDFVTAAGQVNGPARAAFSRAAELVELAALSEREDGFAEAPEELPAGFAAWPREAFLGGAIAEALGNDLALYFAAKQDFAAAAQAMEAQAVAHADPLPSQFAEQGAKWFTAAESALAEFAFRGAPPAGLPFVARTILERLEGLRFQGIVIAYLAGAARDAIYEQDFVGAAAAFDAIAASPTPFAEFARNGAEALRLVQRDVYRYLSNEAIITLQLLEGGFPEVEAAIRYGNSQLAAVLARRHELVAVAAILESELQVEPVPERAAGVLEQGFASLAEREAQALPIAVREAVGRAVLELAGAAGVLADPRGSRPRARARLEAGGRHLLLARELLAREILDTLLVRPKTENDTPQGMVIFDDKLVPVVHGLDGTATKELDEAAADAHDTMGRHVDYSLFFRRANRRYLERLAAESRKWQAR